MKTIKTMLVAGVLSVGFAMAANAAVFVKYDGVDGEAKDAQWEGAGTLWLTTESDPVAIGLLLPAVQKVRSAARPARAATVRMRAFESFELTDTDAGMQWTLHDATAAPAGENRVKIAYSCKDWRNLRTGETGSDCARPAARGNVETEFKVEKGE